MGEVLQLTSNLHSVIYFLTGSPKIFLVLFHIFHPLERMKFHSEAEDVFAPMLPQMVQFSSVWVQG